MTDRQARDLPLDAHLHTDLSPDSDVPIDAYADQAVERGIAEIAITDHVDFAPGTPAYRYATFATASGSVRDAAERWAARGVAIRFGVEITWDSAVRRRHPRPPRATHVRLRDRLGPRLSRLARIDRSNVAAWVAGRSLAEIVAPYFDEVLRGARSGLFDAIGHLDFVKRYLAPHVTAADLAGAPELYEPILSALVESGTGARDQHQRAAPGSRARRTRRCRSCAGSASSVGERVTIGSDAHRADTFAWALADGYRCRIGGRVRAAHVPAWRRTRSGADGHHDLTRRRDVRCDPRRRRDRAAGTGSPSGGRLGVRPPVRPLPPAGLSLHRQPRPPPVGRGGPDAARLRQGPGGSAALRVAGHPVRGLALPAGQEHGHRSRTDATRPRRPRRRESARPDATRDPTRSPSPDRSSTRSPSRSTALTDEQRDAIALRFFAGLSAREAAVVMGKQEGTIRGLQFRAIAAIAATAPGSTSRKLRAATTPRPRGGSDGEATR